MPRKRPSTLLLVAAAALLIRTLPAHADNIFVAFDSNNDTVQEYASAQITGSTYTGTTYINGSGSELAGAGGLAFDGYGNLYVSNANSNQITEYAPGGAFIRAFNAGSSTPLNQPDALAFDQYGNLYVANTNGSDILEFSATSLTPGGTPAATQFGSSISTPYGLAFDSSGNLYVSDYGNSRIYQIQPGGQTNLYINTPGESDTINHPAGLAFDSQGNLYVANQSSLNDVEEFTGTNADRVVADGSENINTPDGLAFDSSGDLFVVNYSHTPPDTGSSLPYGYSSIEEFGPEASGSNALLETFNENSGTNFNLKDGGYIAIETDGGTPLLDSVPEPSSWALAILGIGSFAGLSRIRKRRA